MTQSAEQLKSRLAKLSAKDRAELAEYLKRAAIASGLAQM